jgi:methylamine utilization protein MauJ
MKVPPGKSRAECERLLLHFLSTLAWVEEAGFLVDGVGGGNLPRPMGRNKAVGFSICHEFDLSYLPEPDDDRAMLALALMREGRGGYSFLSLYRVLEVALGRGWQGQVAWINGQVANGLHHRARSALEDLRNQGIIDIGAHLYASGRCAMAHASGEPIIDPDDPADARRLWSERPIMLTLAEKAIEEFFGVETRGTQYAKHLYELDGFKRILGDELTAHLLRGDDPAEQRNVDIPVISVLLRQKSPFEPLSNLAPKSMNRDSPIPLFCYSNRSMNEHNFDSGWTSETSGLCSIWTPI